MKRHNLAFIDVETTGFDPIKNEMIEIAGIVAKQIPQAGRGPKLEIIDEFEFKIKPEHLETADPEALRINGYNEAEWLFAPSLTEVMKAISEKTIDAILVAQNVMFDHGFLQAAFQKTGVQNKMHYHKLDLIPMAFAKLYHDEKAVHFNLRALAEYFSIKNEKAHSALSDIRTTFEIYKRLLDL